MQSSKIPPGQYKYDRVKPPKSIFDVPRFLKELLGGFFTRLFYIFSIVWKSGPIFLFLMCFVALFNGLMPVAGAVISAQILNELQIIITESAMGKAFTLAAFWGSMVLLLLIAFFTYRILNKVVTRLSNAVTRMAGERVVRHVKIEIMNKAQALDLSAFDLPAFYEKLENANREAGNRPVSILSSTFSVISTVISLVGYMVILATALPIAAFAIALAAIPSALVNFIYRRRSFAYMRGRSVDRRQMNYYASLTTNKDLAKEIRMYDIGDELKTRYNNVFERYYRGLRSLIIKENIWQIVLAVLTSLLSCFFFAYIAWGVFEGTYLIGDYSLYTGALTSISTSVTTLITTSATIYEGTLFIDNLLSFLKEKSLVVPRIKEPLHVKKGTAHTVEFRHVSFAYPDTTRRVIDDLCLTLDPGETVALVGLNGAGKTTLIKLLTRLYDPTEGEILLDGYDLRDYDVGDVRRLFGIVFQDFGKYAFNVRDNIRLGNLDRDGTEQDIRHAAAQAGADSFIDKLADGYDTNLMRYFDAEGTELSGGQWQKLSLSRAFYSDADIIILDEPTASLDPLAEQEVFRRFDELRGNKTTVFVSHRLSSATVASKIVVLENGRVAEEGNHRALMDKNGQYAKLFRIQAERYLEESGTK
ncbi:MAG: ABC transporter ATP-binding protein [Ruminococcaceae bacterium]|nr:ABC transporter ATP-binding protein [Oscillospiraceae bacterium]